MREIVTLKLFAKCIIIISDYKVGIIVTNLAGLALSPGTIFHIPLKQHKSY